MNHVDFFAGCFFVGYFGGWLVLNITDCRWVGAAIHSIGLAVATALVVAP